MCVGEAAQIPSCEPLRTAVQQFGPLFLRPVLEVMARQPLMSPGFGDTVGLFPPPSQS